MNINMTALMNKGLILMLIPLSLGLGFMIGINYDLQKSSNGNDSQVSIGNSAIQLEDNLVSRCGDIPFEARPISSTKTQGLVEINGLLWSPDCRYIISSLSTIGRGLPPGSDSNVSVNLPTGIFLYKDSTKSLVKIYKDGTVGMWKDSNRFTFTSNNKEYIYNISEKTATPKL